MYFISKLLTETDFNSKLKLSKIKLDSFTHLLMNSKKN